MGKTIDIRRMLMKRAVADYACGRGIPDGISSSFHEFDTDKLHDLRAISGTS